MSLKSCDVKRLNFSTAASLVAINIFARQAGLSPITLWRWRKNGWLRTTNIAGRVYITSEDLAEFKRRAAAGEFEREHKVPRRLSVSDNPSANTTNIHV
jgi:hypothetical protein